MVIDSHTHLGQAEDKTFTETELLTSMDEAGIDYSLVFSDPVSGDMSSLEHILDVCGKNPRLKAVGGVEFDTLDVEQINRLCGLLQDNLIVGVKFYLGYDNYYPANEKLFPIYEFCQENNKPVIFHTGALETGDEGQLKYSHPLNIDEVAHLYPDLKIIMAHMGNPWLMDAAAVMSKNENVYADLSGFFDENQPIDPKEVDIFIERLKDVWLFLGNYEKCLFGSDFPLYSQKEYLEAVRRIEMSEEEKELVFWKNANQIFNLGL